MVDVTLGSLLPSKERCQCKYKLGQSLEKGFCTKNCHGCRMFGITHSAKELFSRPQLIKYKGIQYTLLNFPAIMA